jgi:hypothetical protein
VIGGVVAVEGVELPPHDTAKIIARATAEGRWRRARRRIINRTS